MFVARRRNRIKHIANYTTGFVECELMKLLQRPRV